MTLSQGLTLLHTLRHLKFRQIFYHIYYRYVSPKRPVAIITERQEWNSVWEEPAFKPSMMVNENEFFFIGEHGQLNDADSWNDEKKSKLWLYNLHYLDDLNACNAEQRLEAHIQLVRVWIDENPVMQGNGWEPYPLSNRLINLVKWWARNPQEFSDVDQNELLESISMQAQALLHRPEYHILGNHLFLNGKALVFAGAFLQGKIAEKCLKKGLEILDDEIKEQFLGDGAHFELSPMYHATLLWDLCDLVNLANISGLKELHSRSSNWKCVISKGLNWLSEMLHPDQDISFFNDAALGIAPQYADIKKYAEQFVLFPSETKTATLRLTHLKASGYCAINLGEGNKAILDVAPIGPNYQPGHAHADTLSFELSLYGQRLFVNSGISQYGIGVERQRQRGTQAHNTVSIDGENSSEVWAGFRVARRAYPQNLSIQKLPESIDISCSHNGFQRLSGRNIHNRKWSFQKGSITLYDSVSGTFGFAESRLHLHPDVTINKVENDIFKVDMSNGKSVLVYFENAYDVLLIDTTWHPQFGTSVSNRCIVARFNADLLTTHVEW